MRPDAFLSVVCLILTFSHVRASGTNLDTRELGVIDIPACGIDCIISTVPASDCSLDDTVCICNNTELTGKIASCMLAKCTMQDSLDTSRVLADVCNLPDESHRLDMFVWTSSIYPLVFVFVCLRIAGKLVNKRLAMDDYIVVFALLLCSIPAGCTLAMTELGFGDHLWNLEDGVLLPILRYFYISWSTYVVVLGLLKVSLLAFYLEIFQTRSFRITAYIFLVGVIINSTIIVSLRLFSCTPVGSFWNRDIKGKCLDLTAMAIANSVTAIVQDVFLLVLPLLFVRKLQMKRSRKISVGLMFAIGTFGCIATIIRLSVLLTFKISVDPTWDYVHVTIWTEVELASGFICVSLPSIRILVANLLPGSVKDVLSHVTPGSKRKNSDPRQALPGAEAAQKQWRKPPSRSRVSLGVEEIETQVNTRKSIMGDSWPWSATSPLTLRFSEHARDGSCPLTSAIGVCSEAGPRLQPWEQRETGYQKNMVELHRVLQSETGADGRHANIDDEITALPNIGCLPDRSYSLERTTSSKRLIEK